MALIKENNFMGLNGFIWFQGVVEDREDPLKLGRVRVRVLGLHTENKVKIPTEALPWAHLMHPVSSAAMSGLGMSPGGLVDGTWVFGFFRDGDSCQEPVVIGSIPGIPEEGATNTVGFYDQRTPEQLKYYPRKVAKRDYPHDGSGAELEDEEAAKTFPRQIHPLDNVLFEPDTNRLARNEDINDTIIASKAESRAVNVPTAMGQGGVWDEPQSAYDSLYPFNHVDESESGHIKEVDDTPGAERLHEWHRTGSFKETHPDGSHVERIVRNNYRITMADEYILVEGNANLTVQGNINIYSKSRIHVQADNDILVWTKKDAEIRVDGDAVIEVHGNVDETVGGSVSHHVDGNYTLDVDGVLKMVGHPIQLNPL